MFGRLRGCYAVFSVVMLASLAGGCASTNSPAADNGQNDPYESFNRHVFALNETLDKNIAEPVAKGYVDVVPDPARDGIHNFLTNLDQPVTLANDILQGEPLHATQTVGRIVVNSTFGLGGLVDLASPMGIPAHTEDFGETLAIYGAGEGPYLVLPLFGPSNPRDASGILVDILFDPFTYLGGIREKGWWMAGRETTEFIDERSQAIDMMDDLRKSSVDIYATLRSLYRQHRNAEIRGGKPDIQNLPNI
ncbi:MAG: VacJ family lipoprotein [Rhizomicrobium sp.]